MAIVTVQRPAQFQVEVSSNTVQSVHTVTAPALRLAPAQLSTTTVSLEEPGSVAVAGSLASVKNYFAGQSIDFSTSSIQVGTSTIKLFGANNTIQLGNSYISLTDSGRITLNGETGVSLQEMSDVPDIASGDANKFLKILPDETGFTYWDIGAFHHTNNFIDLQDTPSTYGTDGQLLKISPDANGFVYFTPPYLTQTEVDSSISSTVTKPFINALNVDAATIDGIDSSDLQNYNNLTNTPTVPTKTGDLVNDAGFITISSVPTALSELSNDVNFATISYVNTTITNIVTKPFVEALNLNVTTFNGQTSTYYLDYDNFTNTPNVPNIIGLTVNKTFVDALGVNADTLDGFDSPYLLDYNNFTNVPIISLGANSIGVFNETLNLHSFVSVSNTSPTNGQILKWDGDQWAAADDSGGGGSGTFTGFSNAIIIGQPTLDYGGNLLTDGATGTLKSTSTVADGFDILNETLLNIRDNTYVRHAEFTQAATGESAGHTGHNHSTLTINFTDAGDYTLTTPQHLWTFETSGADQTSTSQNPSYTWNEPAGGTFSVKHKISDGSARFSGSAGSFSEHSENVVVTTPLPIPAFSADDTSIDLDAGGTTVNFTDTSQYTSHYFWDFGDGVVYPTGANNVDPTGTISTGVAWSLTGNVAHLYTGTSDAQFTVKLYTWHTSHSSLTPHSTHVINEIKTNYISGYVAISPTFTFTTLQGNNQDVTDNVDSVEGHKVTFTDTTTGMGSGFNQTLTWQFSENSADATYIKDSSGTTGYTASGSNAGSIFRYFSRDNVSVPETVSYQVKLTATSGHSSSPFVSSFSTVVVNKDPRAKFTYGIKNNPTGHANYNANNIGYVFTGYDGLYYGIGEFTDTSENVTTWNWDLNNDGTTEQTIQGPVQYTYASAATYSVELIATGATSESVIDDRELKSNIIVINAAPTAPTGLTGKTFTLPSSVGTNPALCYTATNNSTETSPAPGSLVNRQTTSNSGEFETSVLSDYTNKFPSNGTTTASIKSFVNGTLHGDLALNVNDNSGANHNSIYVTDDVDSNSLVPATHPLYFYKQIKAKISYPNHSTGYNTYQIRHSDGTRTVAVGWVQDDLTADPLCSTYSVVQSSAGTLRYMSSIPYYNTNGVLSINNLGITNITGQTYNNTNSFITVENLSGTAIGSQNYTYGQALGTTIPLINLKTSTSINNLSVNLNGSNVGTGTLKLMAVNVNGTSPYSNNTKIINYWYSSPSFDETSLSGPSVTMKRVGLGLSGATPSYTPANFYTSNAWNSETTYVTGTDESVMTPDGIEHITTDFTSYIPVGPNLSSGRSGTQYFTAAFSKAGVNNFTINIIGEVTSLHVAIPGTATDTTSGLNGWLTADTNYFGAGKPGSGSGGNTSDGVANGATTGPITLNSNGTHTVDIKFGPINSSSLGNQGNNILIRFGVASGKSVTAFSTS